MGRWGLPALVLLGFIGNGGCGRGNPPKPDPDGYRQLTNDSGETGSPSLSRDGKFVVYASDRESPDNLEIWVQAVDQENAVRLTYDAARDYDPVFSADGQTVYFTSLREPQGIYRVPAAGGKAELVLRGAVSPEMSPDGQTLLFSDGTGQLATLRLADHTDHADQADQAARPLLKGFFNSYAPKWSADGKEILFAGKATREDPVEWWVTNAEGAAPVNTHLLDGLRGAGFMDAFAQAWLPGDEVLFAGKQGDRMTLWRAKIAADRRGLAGKPVRATNDGAGDFRGAYGAGHLVFERSKGTMNLWSLAVDGERVTGVPQRVTSSDAQKGSASLSADGRTLLYSVDTGAGFRLVLKDLMTQRERRVGSMNLFYGVMSADGAGYAFGEGPPGGAMCRCVRCVGGGRGGRMECASVAGCRARCRGMGSGC
jgi:eukaryotic-like serine/threonine-protein kinase